MLFLIIQDHLILTFSVVCIAGFLWGIYEAAARNPADSGWEDLPSQGGTERLLRSIDGTGRTSVQIRKKVGRVQK
jgi:hypothetical protein